MLTALALHSSCTVDLHFCCRTHKPCHATCFAMAGFMQCNCRPYAAVLQHRPAACSLSILWKVLCSHMLAPLCRNRMALCRQCVAMRSRMLALCSNALALALWKIWWPCAVIRLRSTFRTVLQIHLEGGWHSACHEILVSSTCPWIALVLVSWSWLPEESKTVVLGICGNFATNIILESSVLLHMQTVSNAPASSQNNLTKTTSLQLPGCKVPLGCKVHRLVVKCTIWL